MMRCYKYWAIPASAEDNRKLHEQCRLAADYRRMLVDIENRSRALQRSLWARPMRDIPIEDRKAWRENGGDAALKAWTQTDEYKTWREQITKAAYAAGKWAYAVAGDAGLAWGTRLAVSDAVEHARRTKAWTEDLGFQPCNRVAVQIQSTKPLTNLTVFEQDTRLRIGREVYALGPRVDGFRHAVQGDYINRSGQHAAKRMQQISLRTGTVEGTAQPIFSHLHMIMHRPLPTGQIKGAWAQRRQVGGRWHWEFVLSIDMGETPKILHPRPNSTVGVDVGWRRIDEHNINGMRVAYWYGSDQQADQFVIPHDVERRKAKSADLRSIRDNNRNKLAGQLKAWTAARTTDGIPRAWIDEQLTHVLSWTRMGHFYRLEREWMQNRVDGDHDVLEALHAFLKQDRHLHLWEAHNLTKMQRQIRGRLAAWAHTLCKAYGIVAVEKINLTQLKEVDDPARINSRAIQRLAPGEVIIALKQAASRYGTVIHEVDAAHTTRACSACGHDRLITDQSELMLTCDDCGFEEDQDRTAAKNILRRSESLRDHNGMPTDPSAKKERKKLAARRTRKRSVSAGATSV